MDDDQPPPAELVLAWRCEKWNTLPEGGGIYDQDAHTMSTITSLANIYNTLSHYRSMIGDQIHALTDGERKILRYLIDLHLIHYEPQE